MAKPRAQRTKTVYRPPLSGIARWFSDIRIQSLILVVLGLLLYGNSFTNGYALDDGIVIEKNQYVQEGIRGMGRIFSRDVYQSFYEQMGSEQQLSGGRYRPLSIATFALEQQFFGSNAFVRHLV